jgi:hypothetical protein
MKIVFLMRKYSQSNITIERRFHVSLQCPPHAPYAGACLDFSSIGIVSLIGLMVLDLQVLDHGWRALMRYVVLAMCLCVFSPQASHGQTFPAPPNTSDTNNQRCNSCSTDINLLPPPEQSPSTQTAQPTSALPDAPSANAPVSKGIPILDLKPPILHPKAPTPVDPIWDKKMWAAHIFFAGSMVFDVEATHQGLAHHNCAEGNLSFGEHPGRWELYKDNLFQFVPEVAMDWLGAFAGRSAHGPRWMWKPIGYMGPIYGGTIHLRGGVRWIVDCM